VAAAVAVAVVAADAGKRSNAIKQNEDPAVCKHRGVFFSALCARDCQCTEMRPFRDLPHRFDARSLCNLDS